QAQLAEKASLPQSTVARIELGDNYPSSKTLQAIAKALNKKLSVQLV
ncbi:helix-turn-helix domain-containing protein, partial [Oenococcus oeni]